MERRKRRSWRILLFAVGTGLAAGVIYYAAMTLLNTPTRLESFAPLALLPTDDPAATPLPPTATPVGEFPMLSIPTVGVSAPIVQLQIVDNTWSIFGLGMDVGHLIGTSPLMGRGNIVLVGHVEMADGSPGVFATLSNMKLGERIFVSWKGEKREYNLSTIRSVSPDDVSVLYPSSREQLTLITCSDYDFISNTYLTRVVAVAPRVG